MEKELECPYCGAKRNCKTIQDFENDGKIGAWVWECSRCYGHFEKKTFVGRHYRWMLAIVLLPLGM